MGMHIVETIIDGIKISLETGRIAKQANGSTIVRIGDTMLLSTVCAAPAKEEQDFFPLTVEYIAKTYAAGKIPGGFIKREGKPSQNEILAARIVDRSARPLFPEGYTDEVQIVNTVISADENYNADVTAITSASAALCLSDLPFNEPVSGVRVGLLNGKLKIFPTIAETETGGLDLIVAGTEQSIVMVEGGAYEIEEEKLVEAITFAHEYIKQLIVMQRELMAKVQVTPKDFTPPAQDISPIETAVKEFALGTLHEINFIGKKKERQSQLDQLLTSIKERLAEKFPEQEKTIATVFEELVTHDMRSAILNQGIRIGGRNLDTIRDITCELDILPRTHGSALFTRGETQALVVTTLGSKLDEQRVDELQTEYKKSYMLHYNFPPFSVGEVKRLGSVSRREIGHGNLAERALAPILPSEKNFPYTIRIVSEILESNGSSSMASICGGSLSLMAAGVPIKSHVAGVAMGLIKEDEKVAVLSDILGAEDHMGDMDFKVAGTRKGVTAIQMDIKIRGITPGLMQEALEKAKSSRFHILDLMEKAIKTSRLELSPYAPRIFTILVDKEHIGEIIGPGGRVVREIQEQTGVEIHIQDTGMVEIFATDAVSAEAAKARIKAIVAEPELGQVYEAKIKNVVEFGAFAEFLPGKEGLIHISELDTRRVARTEDVVHTGDTVKVKVIGFDRNGKIRLSMKALMMDK